MQSRPKTPRTLFDKLSETALNRRQTLYFSGDDLAGSFLKMNCQMFKIRRSRLRDVIFPPDTDPSISKSLPLQILC
ncbi:hypothetical protein L0128_03620 [candidate division KSB1 bacterium]|nr:hypothetical protein [candidate division KSB1 bacterium]